MANTGTLMAKKKAVPATPDPAVRKVVFQMKGSEEWKNWLDELAKTLRMPSSAVVDNALVMYAKAQGFTKPAPER
jgi:hypothetical protein